MHGAPARLQRAHSLVRACSALLSSSGPAPLLCELWLPPLCRPCCQAGKRFDVVVVDSRPLFEGRRMLTTLLAGGITCEYCHLNGLSYEITEVDKVRDETSGCDVTTKETSCAAIACHAQL